MSHADRHVDKTTRKSLRFPKSVLLDKCRVRSRPGSIPRLPTMPFVGSSSTSPEPGNKRTRGCRAASRAIDIARYKARGKGRSARATSIARHGVVAARSLPAVRGLDPGLGALSGCDISELAFDRRGHLRRVWPKVSVWPPGSRKRQRWLSIAAVDRDTDARSGESRSRRSSDERVERVEESRIFLDMDDFELGRVVQHAPMLSITSSCCAQRKSR